MAADKWPTRSAITFQGKTQTWQQTLQRCHGAATLLAQSGIEKGDRVAFLGLNSNAVFESYFSPSMIGAIMVPINYRLSVREMVECVEDCTPKVLIVDPHFIEQAEEIRAQCACIITVIACGEESVPATMLSYEDSLQQLITAGTLCELSPSQDDETVIIFYTGGTTGRSKGVMLSNINFKK